jgi:hypothetical protein
MGNVSKADSMVEALASRQVADQALKKFCLLMLSSPVPSEREEAGVVAGDEGSFSPKTFILLLPKKVNESFSSWGPNCSSSRKYKSKSHWNKVFINLTSGEDAGEFGKG